MARSDLQIEQNATIAARLRELRSNSGLTHVELAAKVGCSPTYVLRLESGIIPVGAAWLQLAAQALNVDLMSFFTSSVSHEDRKNTNVLSVQDIEERLAS